MPESPIHADQRGRPVCMVIFAVAADVAALSRALAKATASTEPIRCDGAPYRGEGGGAQQRVHVADVAAGHASSDDVWSFSSTSATCSSLPGFAGLPGHISLARHEAALGEVRQWQRLLSNRHVPFLRSGVPSCASGRSTRDSQVDYATACGHERTTATDTQTDLLSSKRNVPLVCSTEGTQHSYLFWACAPQTILGSQAVEFNVVRSPYPTARGGVDTDASPPSRHALLCIDVGGMYLATSRTCPMSPGTQGALPKPPGAVATKALKKTKGASSRPKAAGLLYDGVSMEQGSSIDAPKSDASSMADGRNAQVSRNLCCLLQQRFAAATRTCPFKVDIDAAACPLVLAEVWVVPLLTEEEDNSGSLSTAHLGLSAFPARVHDQSEQKSADYTTGAEDSAQAFRVTRHPPAHVLRLAKSDHANLVYPQYFTTCQAEGRGPRKRPRDKEMGGEDASEESQWLAPHAAHALREAVFFCSCCGCCSAVDRALLTSSATRLQVLEGDFLLRSCWFSAWCCVTDFDITQSFLHRHLGKWTNCFGQCHVFYGILRRCVLAEEAVVRHFLETETKAWVTAYESITSTEGRGSSEAAEFQRSSTEALFTDSACEDSSTEETGARGCERVWPLEELWGLWVRLGWTPPLTWPRVRVSWHFTEGADRSNVRRRCVWELSPSALGAFLSRVLKAVDVAYVQAKSPRLFQDPHGDGGTAEAKGDDNTACPSQVGGTGMSLGLSHQGGTPFFADAQRESLIQVQRLLEFRAAFSATTELVTQPAPAEMLDFTAASTRAPAMNLFTATAFEDVGGASPHLSTAARDLAADIAATTGFRARHSVTFPASGASDVASFSLTWLGGVLESPALLIPPLSATGIGTDREGAEDLCDASLRPSGRSAVDREAASLTAFLASKAASRLEKLSQSTSEAYSPPYPPQATPLSLPSDAEMYCEVADVAELRWSSSQVANTESDPKALFSTTSQTPALVAPSVASSSASCCASACVKLARLARAKTADEAVNVYRTSHRQLSTENPLSALLFTRCVEYLQRHGVLATPLSSSSEEGGGESKMEEESKKADERILRDVCAAQRSVVAMSSSSPPSPLPPPEGHLQGGAAALHSPRDGCSSENKGEPSGECDAISTILAGTVVRIVQQNKSVVRRMLALIQSYSGVIAEATAEGNVGARFASNQLGAASAESLDPDSRDAAAHGMWRCLEPEKEASVHSDEDAGHLPSCASSCAKATAQRLVQAFWENVASAAREHLYNERGYFSSDEEGSNRNSEEDEPAEGAALTSGQCDDAACLRADAVGPIFSERSHQTVAMGNGAAPMATKSCTLSPSSRPRVHAFPHFPLLPCASMPRHLASSASVAHPSGLLRRAVRTLDGAQAMALYMQHVLRCSAAAGQRRARSRLDGCPFLSCAAVEPRAAVPSKTDTAASPASPPQHNHWIHHGLFLLSYGLACPTDQSAASSGAESIPAAAFSQDAQPVCAFPEGDKFALPPPPALAAFRALRSGKLLLDVWIGAALEAYVRRWKLSGETRSSL
ncbi:hypothetical protein JKF63_01226 [Porcisia hertigi]|uniref:Uncharacterized protein n=1 Tax=Porcisia hertigi TaxID=2761500 RepID=A0A836HUB1_9TRYP|nr:hypothetical protein JKF63_01226 [Porcisia hertigi]